jgi:hypothetical protein
MRYLDAGQVECLGQTIRSATPAFSMARRLIDQGYPPDAEVLVYARNGTPSLSGTLGGFAGLSVAEGDGPPRFIPYAPYPHTAERRGRPQEEGGYRGSGQLTKAAGDVSPDVETVS